VSHGTFSGEPKTQWLTDPNQPDRNMRLLEDFSFTDPTGKKWMTPKDYVVDGASIPQALWTTVGSPYTGDYRRASIVHDKACDDAVNDPAARRAADRMFYQACRAGGCSIEQATLLYIGVRIGGVWPHILPWVVAVVAPQGPRREKTPADQRIEADFRLVAHEVLAEPETDDPVEIEARTDRAITNLTGFNAPGR
jgi:Protein of unknown function (DUF1353)